MLNINKSNITIHIRMANARKTLRNNYSLIDSFNFITLKTE